MGDLSDRDTEREPRPYRIIGLGQVNVELAHAMGKRLNVAFDATGRTCEVGLETVPFDSDVAP